MTKVTSVPPASRCWPVRSAAPAGRYSRDGVCTVSRRSITILLLHPSNATPRPLVGIKRQAGFVVPVVQQPVGSDAFLRRLRLPQLLESSKALLKLFVHTDLFPIQSLPRTELDFSASSLDQGTGSALPKLSVHSLTLFLISVDPLFLPRPGDASHAPPFR